MDVDLQRKSEKLYGSQRLVAAERQARKLKEDHVVLKGTCDSHYNPISTARDSYIDPATRRGKDDRTFISWDSSTQNQTNISLGYGKGASTSLFQDDFTAKPPQYKGLVVPKETYENHWTDCNPKYAPDEQTSPSVYGKDFDGSKSYREWADGMKSTGKRIGRRSKTTHYQKSTHFTLGSDSLDMLTETQKNFVDSQGPTDPVQHDPTQTQGLSERKSGNVEDLSCVFRSGDYNVTQENAADRFKSINQKDFTTKEDVSVSPETSTESYTGQKYQTSTHFEFGTSRDEGRSVYHQDYVKDRTLSVPTREPIPPAHSGKVLPEIPGAALSWGSTTNRSSYRPHNVQERESDRLTAMKENQGKHKELAVTLTCRNTQDPMTTVMKSSYEGLGSGTRPTEPTVPPQLPYRHLESNDALSNPTRTIGRSEAQDSYRASGRQVVKGPLNTDRHMRQKDNKNTHFHLGFDKEDSVSEQMDKFDEKKPTDADIPAAGKSTGTPLDYSIVSHNVDMCHQQPTAADRAGAGSVASSMQNVLLQRTLLKMDSLQDLQLMKLRKAFLEVDKNLEGTVSVDDARTVCGSLDLTLCQADIDEHIHKCTSAGLVDYHKLTLGLLKAVTSSKLDDPHTASLTGRDYTDPSSKKLTPMQQLVFDTDHKRFVPSIPSHYFHKDHKGSHLSTAREDYIHPVMM